MERVPIEDDSRLSDMPARVFIWTVWAVLFAIALRFVWACAPTAPCGDDYNAVIPLVSGQVPLTPGALWVQVNEHRLPLPRLLLVGLARVSRGQFWLENLVNVLLLGSVAALAIRAVRRLRGRSDCADAFLPLVLLHLGHAECLTFRMTLNHVLPAVLSILVLLVIASGQPLARHRLVLIGGLLLPLPLCGANGLPVVLAGALWLVLNIVQHRVGWAKEDGGNPAALPGGAKVLSLLLAGLALGLLCFYFVGYQRPPHHPLPSGWRHLCDSAGLVLTRALIPDPHLLPAFILLVMPGILMTSIACAGHCWLSRPAERSPSMGLLLFLGAMTVVALGIGLGRAALSAPALGVSRYGTVMVPLLVAVYMTWVKYSPRILRAMACSALFALVCMTITTQYHAGRALGNINRQWSDEFLSQLQNGNDPVGVAERFAGKLYPHMTSLRTVNGLQQLQELGWKPYAALKISMPHATADNAARSVLAELKLDAVNNMTWQDNKGAASGADPFVVLRLPEPQLVKSVIVEATLLRDPPAPATLELFWKLHGRNDFNAVERTARMPVQASANKQSFSFRVDDTIDRLRLDPDEPPCTFILHDVKISAGETIR